MTTHISPRETADRLVAEYAEIDPMDAHEAAEGICAGLDVIDGTDVQKSNVDIQTSESAYYPLTSEQIAEGHITEERR